MSEKRVSCPACHSVGWVKTNGRGDPYLTCSKCGPWNGRGPAFREWLANMPAVAESKPEAEPAPAVETAAAEPPNPDNWLDDL